MKGNGSFNRLLIRPPTSIIRQPPLDYSIPSTLFIIIVYQWPTPEISLDPPNPEIEATLLIESPTIPALRLKTRESAAPS